MTVPLTNELWNSMESYFDKRGTRYQKLRNVFDRGLNQYRIAVINVPKYIGGAYYHRDHIGDPHGRIPFDLFALVLAIDKQKEALRFLTENIFSAKAFSFSPELLNKLAPERFYDFTDSIWKMKRLDYPIHDKVLEIQTDTLNRLYAPLLLQRMLDLEIRNDSKDKPLSLVELFQTLRNTIWSELTQASNINSFRRALQREHLSKLIDMIVNLNSDAPEDARTLARLDLLTLNKQIEKASQNTDLDTFTRAHLQECQARIQAALKAGIEQKIRGKYTK